MQDNKKEMFFIALGKTIKKLKGNKSQYAISGEYGIPQSVLSDLERGIKDPQLSTVMKISEALGLRIDEFMTKLLEELPENFKLTDE